MKIPAIKYNHIGTWLHRVLLLEKLSNPPGLLLLAFVAVITSAVVYLIGWKPGALLTGFFLAVPVAALCFVNLHFGIAVVVIASFLINFVSKYTYAPVGTALDGLLFLLLFSSVVRISMERDWRFPRGSIGTFVVLWIGYNLIQVLNPMAASKMAWLYTVRSLAILQLMFFIAHYAISDLRHIKLFTKVILAMAFIAALYGLKQEFFGYSSQEWEWLYQSRSRYRLIVQWNRYRVFSLFSDPTTCGTLMAYMGTFCFVLSGGPFKKRQRLVLAVAGISMYMCMIYAGSRTPFILIPAALLLYTLLRLKREVLIGAGIFLLLSTAFVMKSTSNPVIFRIQSAFRPTTDASVQVRLENQKIIQPYIQQHPFGAGLGSTGIWGERFSPDSWLAGFAHDSAYVRIAIENGWIGLILYLGLFFAAMRTSIYYYFRVHDPRIKTLYLGFSIIIFMLALASYPQEVVTLLPNSIVFYILLAVIMKLKDFDTPPATVHKTASEP